MRNIKGLHDKKILLTNDDGIKSHGMWDLFREISKEYSIIVVAPSRERSGTGHAFTFNKPLHYEKKRLKNGLEGFVVSGTPVDCVKFAISYLLPERPGVVVAGLNRGENSGLSAFYSGTVAAAREGAFWGITGIAFSLCNGGERYAREYAAYAAGILKWIIFKEKRKIKHNVYYNVNFPACSPRNSLGIKITTQSLAFFDDRYETIDVGAHYSKRGFMIYGDKKNIEQSTRFDSFALMRNYITITPLDFDATALKDYRHLHGKAKLILKRGKISYGLNR
ncbi:MAG: 5'/3'-nucleotidase SurE [Chitinispirillaceae bacterium]|nr:5'/3'-nucleotidase SurE [Chitinispirillaceae bacterium]